jgi:hypothetical protein
MHGHMAKSHENPGEARQTANASKTHIGANHARMMTPHRFKTEEGSPKGNEEKNLKYHEPRAMDLDHQTTHEPTTAAKIATCRPKRKHAEGVNEACDPENNHQTTHNAARTAKKRHINTGPGSGYQPETAVGTATKQGGPGNEPGSAPRKHECARRTAKNGVYAKAIGTISPDQTACGGPQGRRAERWTQTSGPKTTTNP